MNRLIDVLRKLSLKAEAEGNRRMTFDDLAETLLEIAEQLEQSSHVCQTCFDGEQLPDEGLERADLAWRCPACNAVYEPA